MRLAAVLAWITGLIFGVPCVYAIWYLADHGHVWTFMGFPTYGEGPFEDIGIDATVPLLAAFLLVCAAEMVAGWMLGHRRRAGAMLALTLLPLESAFWIGSPFRSDRSRASHEPPSSSGHGPGCVPRRLRRSARTEVADGPHRRDLDAPDADRPASGPVRWRRRAPARSRPSKLRHARDAREARSVATHQVTCSPAVLTGQAAGVRWVCPPSFQVAATSRGVR